LCCSGGFARAAEPVRLQWVRLEGAESCIDSTTLAERVRERLASEPFDAHAARSIEGVVQRSAGTWRAQIAVRSQPSDAQAALRQLESNAEDCSSLSNAVVLAVALAIDPNAALSAPPPSAPARSTAAERSDVGPQAGAAARDEGLAGRADLAVVTQLGLLPRMSLGLGLGTAAVLSRRFELAVLARAFPAIDVSGDPAYAIGLALVGAQLCARLLEPGAIDLRACGGPSLGILHAAVLEGDRTQPGERAWVGAELGLDAGFVVSRSLSVLLGARAVAPVTRYRFTVEGSNGALFQQPAVAAVGHVGLELLFGHP
jgi:hypothetical protein